MTAAKLCVVTDLRAAAAKSCVRRRGSLRFELCRSFDVLRRIAKFGSYRLLEREDETEVQPNQVLSFEAGEEDPCFNLFNPSSSMHPGVHFHPNVARDQGFQVNMGNTENVLYRNDVYYQAGGVDNEGSNLAVFHDAAGVYPGSTAFPTQIERSLKAKQANICVPPDKTQLDEQDLALFFPEIMGAQAFGSHQTEHSGNLIDPASALRGTGESVTKINMRPGREAGLVEMQTLIETQRRQIYELNSRLKKSQRQAEVLRDKAMTYRALYSQQQLVSEQLMSSIVQLRDQQNRPRATGGPSNSP
ncbi:hypothetical protein BKA70DRAFT_1235160 [Coprinopsis sp. MPI-PUGE-AT-0042]|nr:hypothetical protein BKA70DRAFT_1235160 [Coprinopsis sp. MPI-PUGE-AT-0042]